MLKALAWLALSLAVGEPAVRPASAGGPVVVIPVQGMIERGLVYMVRRGVAEAASRNAVAIVLDMDTPGGRLDATEDIVRLMSAQRIPTYTYVNHNAISAGAIIALSTRNIHMAPGSRIGDAMPILMSPLPMGGPQAMPDDLKEKAVSPTVALIRSAAERNGHDTQLAEAMVRIEFEYVIDDDVICPAGQLLTLTDREAARIVNRDGVEGPLLSRGTVDTLDDLLAAVAPGAPMVRIQPHPGERVARVIEGFPLSGILLAVGLLLLYTEIRTPGIGLPGIAGALLLAIWFWGHHIAGLAGSVEVLLFLIGLLLLGVEVFLIPGFGVTGVAGITCMLVALMLAMVESFPGSPWRPPVVQIERMIQNLGTGMLLAVAGGVLLARLLPETHAFRRLMLLAATDRERGYVAAAPRDRLVGKTGRTVTDLRPGGIAQFGDQRMDVLSQGDFIERGATIVVTEARGNRLVVEQAAPAAPAVETA